MSWDKERIVELLLEAGDMAREARKKRTLEIKSDHSLVTQAYTAIEVLFPEALEDEARTSFEVALALRGGD